MARTRAKAKRLDTEQRQNVWAGSGAEVETLAEKNTRKTWPFPPTVSPHDAISVSNRPTLKAFSFIKVEESQTDGESWPMRNSKWHRWDLFGQYY